MMAASIDVGAETIVEHLIGINASWKIWAAAEEGLGQPKADVHRSHERPSDVGDSVD